MHVKIVGFKCHLDSSYYFDNNSMVLLKGDSGVGKSTILQAIFWAMYGSMRGIYNNTGQIKTCNVTLKVNDLVIYRQKRPELLRVTIKSSDNTETTYEDEVAQQIINSAFSSKDLWKACSYISQKKRCALLSGSAKERLDLLNQLSFDQDDPKVYINTIDTKLKEITTEFTNTQAAFTAELDLFTKQINTKPISTQLSLEEINQLRQDISVLEADIQRLYQEVLNHERNIGSYNMLSNQISQAHSQLNTIPDINFDETQYNKSITELNNNINRLREQIALINHYTNSKSRADKLSQDINNLNHQITNINQQVSTIEQTIEQSTNTLVGMGYDPSNPITVSQQDIWNTSQKENQFIQYQNECKQLGCEYNQDSINILIGKYQNEISVASNMQRYAQLYNQLKSLQTQIVQYNHIDLTENKIKELENINSNITSELSELRKGLELLQCPNCSIPLRHVGTQLIQGDRDPVSPEVIQAKQTEMNNNQNIISQIRSGMNIVQQINNINEQLNGIDIANIENYIKTPVDINSYNALVGRLSRVVIVVPPTYSSSYLQTIYNYQQLVNSKTPLEQQKLQLVSNLNSIEEQLSSIQIPNIPSHNLTDLQNEISNNNNEINALNQNKQQYMQHNNRRDQLISNINQLILQKDNIEKMLNPSAKTLYENSKTMLEINKTRLVEGEYANKIIEQQKQLESKREKVIQLNNSMMVLQRLKQNAINIECKQLQDTVDTINQTLADILPLFFNEPIEMVLQLYKTLKTKKEIKPGLNIVIKHKGTEYDDLDQLSGGEGDRISLALVLALNQVSNSPVIMLDECVSSLDGNLKEACIKTMRDISGKTIICVDHEGVEGYYDKTVVVSH